MPGYKHVLLSSSCLVLCACTTTLPDVAPFSEATVNLRSSISAAGDAVIEELERLQVKLQRVDQLREACHENCVSEPTSCGTEKRHLAGRFPRRARVLTALVAKECALRFLFE